MDSLLSKTRISPGKNINTFIISCEGKQSLLKFKRDTFGNFTGCSIDNFNFDWVLKFLIAEIEYVLLKASKFKTGGMNQTNSGSSSSSMNSNLVLRPEKLEDVVHELYVEFNNNYDSLTPPSKEVFQDLSHLINNRPLNHLGIFETALNLEIDNPETAMVLSALAIVAQEHINKSKTIINAHTISQQTSNTVNENAETVRTINRRDRENIDETRSIKSVMKKYSYYAIASIIIVIVIIALRLGVGSYIYQHIKIGQKEDNAHTQNSIKTVDNTLNKYSSNNSSSSNTVSLHDTFEIMKKEANSVAILSVAGVVMMNINVLGMLMMSSMGQTPGQIPTQGPGARHHWFGNKKTAMMFIISIVITTLYARASASNLLGGKSKKGKKKSTSRKKNQKRKPR